MKERLTEIENKFNYDHGNTEWKVVAVKRSDLEWLIKQAKLTNATILQNTGLSVEFEELQLKNNHYREVMESSLSEIEYALYSNKTNEVKEHYLKNVERYITEALEGEE